jgi:hypothetical protein
MSEKKSNGDYHPIVIGTDDPVIIAAASNLDNEHAKRLVDAFVSGIGNATPLTVLWAIVTLFTTQLKDIGAPESRRQWADVFGKLMTVSTNTRGVVMDDGEE